MPDDECRWSPGPALLYLHDWPAAIAVGAGELIVAGGFMENRAELVSLGDGTSRPISSLSTARRFATAIAVNAHQIALLGGYVEAYVTSTGPAPSVEVYDLPSATWRLGPEALHPLHGRPKAVVADGSAWVVSSPRVGQRLILGELRWETLPPLPSGRGRVLGASTEEGVPTFVANDGQVLQFEVATHTWVELHPSSFEPNDRYLYVGPFSDFLAGLIAGDRFIAYSREQQQWVELPPPPLPWPYVGVPVAGRIVVRGFQGGPTALWIDGDWIAVPPPAKPGSGDAETGTAPAQLVVLDQERVVAIEDDGTSEVLSVKACGGP